MKTGQCSGKRVCLYIFAALLALSLLAGFGTYWYRQTSLTDISSSDQLLALIEDTTGRTDAQVQNIKTEGNLAVVSYSADDRQGILLLERTGGQDDDCCRLLDWEESGAGLHTYRTSFNGVVDVTVLYGENTEGAKSVSIQSSDTFVSYTLENGCVLELNMNPGASSDSQTELLYCGG